MLDTNTVSDYLRGNAGVLYNLKRHHRSLVSISSIIKYELFYGLLKNPEAHKKYGEQLRLLFEQAQDLVFDAETALLAAEIKDDFMNTPSHYIINLAILGNTIAPKNNVAITIGAILPDIPIFIFYLVSKFIYKLPEAKIWSEAYYETGWQNFVALFHSIPLALIGSLVFYYLDWKPAAIICFSAILHSCLDLPLHHDDAHRHFFPFSDYRLISPVSYWDVKHYGRYAAFIEICFVLAANPIVLGLLNSPIAKGIVIAIDFFYIVSYYRFYL